METTNLVARSDGLAPNKGPIHWRIYASLGVDELSYGMWRETKLFIHEKPSENVAYRNGGHFVQREMS